MHADALRVLHLPGQPRHDIGPIGAAYADGQHSQAAGVGGVRVGAYHQSTGESIIFKHYLMYYSCTRFPKPYAVLACGRF